MSLSFRETLNAYLPPFLRTSYAYRYMWTIASLADAGVEFAYQGFYAKLPGYGTPTALPLIGRDRVMRRGFDESDESYGARLAQWLPTKRTMGNAFSIMRQVKGYLSPHTPKMRVVNASGTWYTLNSDDTVEIHQTWPTQNFDWDGQNATLYTRCWLIIYPPSSLWVPGPTIGDPSLWGGAVGTTGYTIGSTATPEQVASIRAILAENRCGGDRFEKIIIAFDPNSFDPTGAPGAPLPDGTWAECVKLSGGNYVPSRISTAIYWRGPDA